jgi:ABC-type iron transport system FetAB permease component
MASVPRVKGPASSEALSSRTFVLRVVFELSNPYCVFLFVVVICFPCIYTSCQHYNKIIIR